MDWSRYRRLCDDPTYLSRWMLEQTRELCAAALTGTLPTPLTRAELAELEQGLTATLAGKPLAKPADFKGDAALDMLPATLSPTQAGSAEVLLQAAVSKDQRTTGTTRRGLGGFVAAWAECASALHAAANPGELPMANPAGRVQTLIDAFNANDLDAVLDCFAADAIYHNIPMEAVQGVEAIRATLKGFMDSASEVDWQVRSSAVAGNRVLNERLDRFLVGGQWLELPVMGIFEIEDDRIVHWRDYFDLGDFQKQMAAIAG